MGNWWRPTSSRRRRRRCGVRLHRRSVGPRALLAALATRTPPLDRAARPSQRHRLGSVPGLRPVICGRSRRAAPVALAYRCRLPTVRASVPLAPEAMGIWWSSRVSGSARGSVSAGQAHGYLVAPARLRRALPRESGHLPQRTRTARSAHVHLVARGESYTVRFRA